MSEDVLRMLQKIMTFDIYAFLFMLCTSILSRLDYTIELRVLTFNYRMDNYFHLYYMDNIFTVRGDH